MRARGVLDWVMRGWGLLYTGEGKGVKWGAGGRDRGAGEGDRERYEKERERRERGAKAGKGKNGWAS